MERDGRGVGVKLSSLCDAMLFFLAAGGVDDLSSITTTVTMRQLLIAKQTEWICSALGRVAQKDIAADRCMTAAAAAAAVDHPSCLPRALQ